MNISDIREKYGFSECAINLPDDECFVILGKAIEEDDSVVCPHCGFVIGDIDTGEDDDPTIEGDDDDDDDAPPPSPVSPPPIRRRTPEERMRINFNEKFSIIIDIWRTDNEMESLVYEVSKQRRYIENLYVDLESKSFFPKHSLIMERVIVPVYYTLIYILKMNVSKKATVMIFNKDIHRRVMNRIDYVSRELGGSGQGRIKMYIRSYGRTLNISNSIISDSIFLWEESEPPYVGRSENAKAAMWLVLYYEMSAGVKIPKYRVSELIGVDRRALSAVEEVYRDYLQSIIEKA